MAKAGQAPDVTMFPKDGETPEGLPASVSYLVSQFLDDSHFDKLHATLSKWDRTNSLSAAMKLMEQYGVVLSKEEIDKLQQQDEAQQINALVMKMPEQSNEQFQHFFLQLQLIVSTATRVRQALEGGQYDQVQAALDEADSTGITPYILNMAVVQAGSEVMALKKMHEQWCKDTDAKMARLVRGQDDLIQSQKKLSAAQALLAQYTTGANEKSKSVLMRMSGGNENVLKAACFKEWTLVVAREKEHREIAGEFDVRIERATAELVAFKSKRLEGVRNVLNRKAAEGDAALLAEVLGYFKDLVEDKKIEAEKEAKIKELEEKLNGYKNANAEKTKAVMLRMSADGDSALVAMCWQAFLSHHKDYAKNKEFEDAVKAQEKQMQDFLNGKKEGTKSLLAKVGSGSDTVVLGEALQAWIQLYKEEKKERELEELINGGNGKFASFGDRNAKSARGVCDRARMISEQATLMKIFYGWRLTARQEVTMLKYQAKIEAKRQQLVGVQTMFRNFATQLESSLKEDSARETKYNLSGKRMSRENQGSVSLPSIHASK